MVQTLPSNLTSLTGQFLIAMPQLQDPRYFRAVVFVCGHDDNGAMGIVINKIIDTVHWHQLLEQLEIKVDAQPTINLPIHYGGPVEMGRGFVLHSIDYMHEGSVLVTNQIALTATVDILRAMAQGQGPKKRLLALGYAGWSAGQLESELHVNGWLQVEADEEILFHTPFEEKWESAIARLGISLEMISEEMGHA